MGSMNDKSHTNDKTDVYDMYAICDINDLSNIIAIAVRRSAVVRRACFSELRQPCAFLLVSWLVLVM